MLILYKFFHKKNWTVRIYPIVTTSIIIAIYCLYQFRKMDYKMNFSKVLLSQALIYSTPLILHMLSGYVLNIGDRFFIKFFLDDKKLGEYAVAYQIGMSVNFFFTSFNLAWTPTYFKWMKEKQNEKINKVRNLVYISIISLGILIFVLWKFISPFVIQNTNYSISLQLVLIILVSNVIFSLYKYESNYFFYSKKTKNLSYISFTSAIIAIICNIILIKYIGILGAAYSTLISFIYLYSSILRKKKKLAIYSEL